MSGPNDPLSAEGESIPSSVAPDGSSDPEDVYVVIGVDQYPEDGFVVAKAFADKEAAEAYADSDQPSKDVRHGRERYYVEEVPYEGRIAEADPPMTDKPDTDDMEAVEDENCPICGHSPVYRREPPWAQWEPEEYGKIDVYCPNCDESVQDQLGRAALNELMQPDEDTL